MDFFDAVRISSSGLSAQRTRMNVISSNLANAESTGNVKEGRQAYRRSDVVLSAVPANTEFADLVAKATDTDLKEVQVSQIVKDAREPKKVYNPQHPDADEKGFVEYPNINIMEEMVNMMLASRSYEANVNAVNVAKSMAMKALEIGKV